MESILLLGDSLTQQGYVSNWVSNLSNHYIRRAHVINAGLSGYNSRLFLAVLRDPAKRASLIPEHVRRPLFVTLLLGSNDCAESYQAVPVDEYKRNMHDIISFIRTEIQPKGGVFVLTTPPIHADLWNAARPDSRRSFSATRLYRSAIMEVVAEAQAMPAQHTVGSEVILVDVHSAILKHGDASGLVIESLDDSDIKYDPAAPWTTLFFDGLHISPEGGQLFFCTLLEAIRQSPHASTIEAGALPFALPTWDEVLRQQQ